MSRPELKKFTYQRTGVGGIEILSDTFESMVTGEVVDHPGSDTGFIVCGAMNVRGLQDSDFIAMLRIHPIAAKGILEVLPATPQQFKDTSLSSLIGSDYQIAMARAVSVTSHTVNTSPSKSISIAVARGLPTYYLKEPSITTIVQDVKEHLSGALLRARVHYPSFDSNNMQVSREGAFTYVTLSI